MWEQRVTKSIVRKDKNFSAYDLLLEKNTRGMQKRMNDAENGSGGGNGSPMAE